MFCNKAKVPERCNQYSKRWSQIQINMCLEADETKRLRMDGIEPRINEDHIEGKGYSSLHHYNLVHKFIPMPQAMKIQAAKEAVDKEWRKLEKFSAWNLAKVRHKSEVTEEVRHKDVKVHFAWLMDICHLRISELETKYQKNKGRVALRGDIVNDDSYSYVVFVKQGASASQMTAAKIIDIISQLSGCEGQAATQYLLALNSRWKMIQNYWKFHDRNFEIFGYVYQDTHGLNHGPVWKTRSFLLNESCMVILWQDYKVFHWESLSYDHQQKFILPVYVDDIKLTGRKKNINPTWKYSTNKSNWENQRHSLIMYTWSVLKDIAIHANILLTITEPCSNPGFPLEQRDKLPSSENPHDFTWSYDFEGHAIVCGTILRFGKKKLNNYTKYQFHALMNMNSMKKIWNPWVNCQKYVDKLFSNVYIWNELVDRVFHGQSTNLNVRSQNGPKVVTIVWRVWSLTFFVQVNTNNIVTWETQHDNVA